MTPLEKQAYDWALNQKYESVSARYARILAQYIEREAVQLAALTTERDSLRELVRRVKAMGDRLSDDEIYNRLADAYENGQSLELIQLLTDCQEVLK